MTESTSRDGYVVTEGRDGELAECYWPYREGFADGIPSWARGLDEAFGKEATITLQTPGGATVTLHWYDGGLHVTPRKPPRPPAPWRIKCRDGDWFIEKRYPERWEAHRYCATGAEAIATFDEKSRR